MRVGHHHLHVQRAVELQALVPQRVHLQHDARVRRRLEPVPGLGVVRQRAARLAAVAQLAHLERVGGDGVGQQRERVGLPVGRPLDELVRRDRRARQREADRLGHADVVARHRRQRDREARRRDDLHAAHHLRAVRRGRRVPAGALGEVGRERRYQPQLERVGHVQRARRRVGLQHPRVVDQLHLDGQVGALRHLVDREPRLVAGLLVAVRDVAQRVRRAAPQLRLADGLGEAAHAVDAPRARRRDERAAQRGLAGRDADPEVVGAGDAEVGEDGGARHRQRDHLGQRDVVLAERRDRDREQRVRDARQRVAHEDEGAEVALVGLEAAVVLQRRRDDGVPARRLVAVGDEPRQQVLGRRHRLAVADARHPRVRLEVELERRGDVGRLDGPLKVLPPEAAARDVGVAARRLDADLRRAHDELVGQHRLARHVDVDQVGRADVVARHALERHLDERLAQPRDAQVAVGAGEDRLHDVHPAARHADAAAEPVGVGLRVLEARVEVGRGGRDARREGARRDVVALPEHIEGEGG